MRKTITDVSATLASMVLLSGPAGAQGTTQTVEVAKIDVQTLPGGFARPRSSVAASSMMLTKPSERSTTFSSVPTERRHLPCYRSAVSSAWIHFVVVPYDSLNLVDNKIVMRGGTKDTLKMLPEFKYAAK